MRELVFNTENVFNSISEDGALFQYDCNTYHIPAFQRGYKWGSDPNGAVTILLKDLKEAFTAFQKGTRREYYLQYITVKRSKSDEHGNFHLEVIDGQQRLTTLSILFSVLSFQTGKENLGINKLDYAIRANFFQTHINSVEKLNELLKCDWKEFRDKDRDRLDKQDIYYFFEAAKRIDKFLKDELKKDLILFHEFVSKHVMLIVNSVESHVSSETVFRNLNSNKVPLTETELVKGYFITKIGRQGKSKIHFREILELRSNLGRKWDEISAWCNWPDVRSFYFLGGDGMEGLLTITAKMIEGKSQKTLKIGKKEDHHLFNFFHSLDDLEDAYKLLRENYNKLLDWYNRDDIYTLIGFCRFTKGRKNNSLEFLIPLLKIREYKELFKALEKARFDLLPREEIQELRYGGDDDQVIHAVLLYLNVFPDGIRKRFDFHLFETEKWTLEHIFPQSPEGKKNQLTPDQRELVIQMLDENLSDDVREILKKDSRTEPEKALYYEALKSLGSLNSIGNMCLLSNSDNSSNGNKFFKEKRKNILELIQKGSFVPKHTFDVFSKMIPSLPDHNLSMWTRDDIQVHQDYIFQSIQKAREELDI
ncbi:DUF262 domain-containing protein [Rhodonellum sp.]|uniref:DUF262 domain-containing protein n=1 Tax=Rhodonellum sp. TaxID=2231180 RepID=UPI002720BEF7|nr:DUF262 domain-containing protein [Rhodonellum sp.]MDO9554641.1 DUF262 domain-containing protein [Rhodonellum sp.]